MRTKFQTIALAALLALSTAACSSQDDEPQSVKGTAMSVSIRVPSRGASAGTLFEDGYEDGRAYENYVDVDKTHLYFFDKNNEFLCEFDPGVFLYAGQDSSIGGNGASVQCDVYTFLGTVPQEIYAMSEFKILVLANVPALQNLEKGVTTLDDVYSSAVYGFDSSKMPSMTNLMPFFGLQEYKTESNFANNKTTDLGTPIMLLRAMAKIEVIIEDDPDFYELQEISLSKYNRSGMTCPKGVYQRGDYVHGSYELDFVQDVNIPANVETSTKLPLLRPKTGKSDEPYVVYVPEFVNVGLDAPAIIDMKFDFMNPAEKFSLEFRKYEGGVPTGEVYNICRNNIYRYRLRVSDHYIIVHVLEWTSTFDNIFEF